MSDQDKSTETPANETGGDAPADERTSTPPAAKPAAEEPKAGKARKAAAAAEPSKGRRPIDTVMRGLLLIALGAFATTPLWCKGQQTGNFGPTQFRADRSEEDTTEAKLSEVIEDVIKKAAQDQEVNEVEVVRDLSTILADEGLGTPESRAEATEQLVADILAQAAETSTMGFDQMQTQAIRGQARVMARTLITQLGGNLGDGDDDAPEGEWEPAAWPVLSNFEYEEGMELPAEVKALDGKNVMAWGYLLYLEDDQFLLVQSLWSCCFGRPPDLHEAIVVRADPSNRRYEGRGVRVYGRFEAGEMREDGYVTSLYRLDAQHLRPM